MSPDPLFSARHITCGYNQKNIIRDASFSLFPGTLTGLIGANGSGKSTLLKSVCGLIPSSGSRQLGGRSLAQMRPKELARLISYIPQRSGISVSLSALDVVLMGFNPQLRLFQRPSAAQRQQAIDALTAVGLEDMKHADFLTLSEGQKQLCILARTMVEATPLLLLDEPDSALDFHNRYEIMYRIKNMVQKQNRAALVCLHDPQLALQLCDQLLLLKEGSLIAALRPAYDSLSQMEAMLREIYDSVTLTECRTPEGQSRKVLLAPVSVVNSMPDASVLPVGCVIMASGFGKRFGSNKLLAPFLGKPLVMHTISQVKNAPFAQCLTVTRHEEIAALCREAGMEVLLHREPEKSDTIRLGIQALTRGQELAGCLFCPADQPFISLETLEALVLSFSMSPDPFSLILRPCFGNQPGSPVLFGKKYFDELQCLPDGQGGGFLIQKYSGQVRQIPVRNAYELYDIDTPEDLLKLENLSPYP